MRADKVSRHWTKCVLGHARGLAFARVFCELGADEGAIFQGRIWN